jgi:hypothetical protein
MFKLRTRAEGLSMKMIGGRQHVRTQSHANIGFMLALLAVFVGLFEATSVMGRNENKDILSFYMWCQDFKMLPPARCDARRPQDLKAYEQYRAAFERYDEQQSARAKREQELQQRLNRDAGRLDKPTPGNSAAQR